MQQSIVPEQFEDKITTSVKEDFRDDKQVSFRQTTIMKSGVVDTIEEEYFTYMPQRSGGPDIILRIERMRKDPQDNLLSVQTIFYQPTFRVLTETPLEYALRKKTEGEKADAQAETAQERERKREDRRIREKEHAEQIERQKEEDRERRMQEKIASKEEAERQAALKATEDRRLRDEKREARRQEADMKAELEEKEKTRARKERKEFLARAKLQDLERKKAQIEREINNLE